MEYSLMCNLLQGEVIGVSLNPYSNGILSDTVSRKKSYEDNFVLILILMEYSLIDMITKVTQR